MLNDVPIIADSRRVVINCRKCRAKYHINVYRAFNGYTRLIRP